MTSSLMTPLDSLTRCWVRNKYPIPQPWGEKHGVAQAEQIPFKVLPGSTLTPHLFTPGVERFMNITSVCSLGLNLLRFISSISVWNCHIYCTWRGGGMLKHPATFLCLFLPNNISFNCFSKGFEMIDIESHVLLASFKSSQIPYCIVIFFLNPLKSTASHMGWL